MNRHQSHFRSKSTAGFTVVECLIALAISAVLLTAVAVAFNASVVSYQENEKMYRTMNNARQALTRMTTQLRTGYAVFPGDPSHRCSFHTATNDDITYEFRDASDPSDPNTLWLITNSDSQAYLLCDNVIAATFDRTLTGDGMDCKSVQISLTVRDGGFERTLSAAAVVRKNLSF